MSGSRLGPQTQVVLVQTSGVRATLDAADAAGWSRRRRTPRVVAHLVAVATAESDAIEQSLHEPRSRQIVLGDAVAVADVAKSFGFAPRHLPLVARFAGRLGFGGRVGQRFGPVAEPSPAATAGPVSGPVARRPVPAVAAVRVDIAGETHVVEYGQYRDVQADRALVFVVASVGQGIREHVPIATETAGATSMRSTGHDARGSYGRADVGVVAPGGGGGVRVVGVETRQFVASSHVG